MEYSDSVDELNVNLFPIQYYAIIEGFLIRVTLSEFSRIWQKGCARWDRGRIIRIEVDLVVE